MASETLTHPHHHHYNDSDSDDNNNGSHDDANSRTANDTGVYRESFANNVTNGNAVSNIRHLLDRVNGHWPEEEQTTVM